MSKPKWSDAPTEHAAMLDTRQALTDAQTAHGGSSKEAKAAAIAHRNAVDACLSKIGAQQ